jgi:hypothetical protein
MHESFAFTRLLRRAISATLLLAAAAGAQQQDKPKITAPGDFARCTERWATDECLEALQGYVKTNPAKAFDAGKAVTLSATHWAAIPFFATALEGKPDGARCRDPRLALAVTSGLGLSNDEKDGPTLAAAKNILTVKCWNELQAPLLKALENGVGYLPANVCPILAEKKLSAKACEKKAPTVRPPPAKWQALDPKTLEVEGSAKVFRGDQGRKVTLVKVRGKDYYLIKFEGFRGPWNNKVVLHREDDMGRGYNYWTQVGKARYVSVVSRQDLGSYFDHEVYPRGDNGPFHVGYDETLSKAAKPEAVLDEFVD